MTGNCTPFMDNPHHCTVIYAVKQIVSSLELIGSLFIIFIIWLFKKYKVFNQRLILALSVAALGASICTMLTGVPQERGPLCQSQAFLLTSFVLAILSWVCCITFNIWKTMRGDGAERLEWYYHAISWGLPLIVASLPFSEDIYGPAGPWCWVSGNVNHSAVWRFSTYYIPLFICITGLFIAYIYFFVTYWRLANGWEGVHGRNNPAELERRTLRMNEVRPMLAYPFIYLVLSMAPFIHRVYNAVSTEPSFVLLVLHVISLPLTGLINAIAFGLDKETWSRLNWDDIKAAFQKHFHFGNSRMDSSMGEHQLGETTCTDIHLDGNIAEKGYDNKAIEESA